MAKIKKLLSNNSGYALLAAIFAINIFAILAFKAANMWETALQRDLEQELLFRARQYVVAIDQYKKKNANVKPKSLDELFEKKFLRKRYKDPMTGEETWNIVMREGRAGKKGLLIVPEEMLAEYSGKAVMVGVCSTSHEEGFLEYRKKKKYFEWAVYLGEKIEKDMPELKYVGEEGYQETEGKDKAIEEGRENDDGGSERENDGRGKDGRGNGRGNDDGRE